MNQPEFQSLKNTLETRKTHLYDSHTKDNKIIWHDESRLFWISEKILEWFYNDEFGVIIVHGQQGYGKSCYALISCAEVYGHDPDKARFYYHWEAVKKHIIWHPRNFIRLSKKTPSRVNPLYKVHPNKKKKEPLCIWDDAGYFLNSMDYRDKFCRDVSKYLEVVRPRWGCIIFTCSMQQQILSKIRGIPHAWSVPIKKFGTPSRHNKNYKYNRKYRGAKLHKSWCSEDLKKSGKKGKEMDIFKADLPGVDDPINPDNSYGFYSWYAPFREMFEEHGAEAMNISAKELGL